MLCISEVAKVWKHEIAESAIKNYFIKVGLPLSTVAEEINVLSKFKECRNIPINIYHVFYVSSNLVSITEVIRKI